MKINPIIVGIVILAVFLYFSQQQKQTSLQQFEGSNKESCFDYQDNDNDGRFDLHDDNCFGLGMEDSDFDGFVDVN